MCIRDRSYSEKRTLLQNKFTGTDVINYLPRSILLLICVPEFKPGIELQITSVTGRYYTESKTDYAFHCIHSQSSPYKTDDIKLNLKVTTSQMKT